MYRPPLSRAFAALLLVGATSTCLLAGEPGPIGEPRIVTSSGDAKQPQIAVDPSGRILVAFGQGNAVKLAVSTDGGKSYEVRNVRDAGSLALGMRRGPRVAATGDTIVVTAVGGSVGKGRDGDVLAWRSNDLGKSWDGPTSVNTDPGSAREGLHGMAAAPDGAVFCTWLDLRNKRTEIYGALSRDGGETWEKDILVYRSPDKSVCECCHPSVAFAPDGTLHVMWRNQLKGARDLYLASSKDGGRTFGEARKLGHGTWKLDACPMDGGAVAAGEGGRVETVWMRAGTMFSATPGEAEQKLGPGVQGWTAMAPDGPYSVWIEKRPGRLLAVRPGDSSPVTIADRAGDPVVASALGGRGPVVAAWEDKSGGGGIRARVLGAGGEGASR